MGIFLPTPNAHLVHFEIDEGRPFKRDTAVACCIGPSSERPGPPLGPRPGPPSKAGTAAWSRSPPDIVPTAHRPAAFLTLLATSGPCRATWARGGSSGPPAACFPPGRGSADRRARLAARSRQTCQSPAPNRWTGPAADALRRSCRPFLTGRQWPLGPQARQPSAPGQRHTGRTSRRQRSDPSRCSVADAG